MSKSYCRKDHYLYPDDFLWADTRSIRRWQDDLTVAQDNTSRPKFTEHLIKAETKREDWILVCDNCGYRGQPNTAEKPDCPQCNHRMIIKSPNSEDFTEQL